MFKIFELITVGLMISVASILICDMLGLGIAYHILFCAIAGFFIAPALVSENEED